MVTIAKQVQKAYDHIVDAYAVSRHGDTPPENLIPFAHQLIQHAGPQGRILEVGCGTGRDMSWFEQHGVPLVGLDLSAGMLRFARTKVTGSLVMMNMQHIGFSANAFDAIWSCASLLHLPKRDAPMALAQMYRVLNGNGLLFLSIQEGQFEGWNGGYVAGVQRYFSRYQHEEMAALLADQGFDISQSARAQAGARMWLSYLCRKT